MCKGTFKILDFNHLRINIDINQSFSSENLCKVWYWNSKSFKISSFISIFTTLRFKKYNLKGILDWRIYEMTFSGPPTRWKPVKMFIALDAKVQSWHRIKKTFKKSWKQNKIKDVQEIDSNFRKLKPQSVEQRKLKMETEYWLLVSIRYKIHSIDTLWWGLIILLLM